jgi:molybdate transport system regulatory protein
MKQTIRFRVDLSPICSIGPGKIELLESIERTGSLSQAARVLGLSYRRAWLLLHDLNSSFNEPAARASIGGNLRGGMKLTAVGKEIIRCYRAASRVIESVAQSRLRPIAAKAVLRRPGNGAAPRKKLARRLLASARG